MLNLGEDLLDWVQVRGIFGQKKQLGPSCANERAHGSAFMAAEVVHDDDVAGSQRGNQDLLDIGSEGFAIDWTVKQPRSLDPIVAQRRQECGGVPVAMRDLADQALATRRPPTQRRHISLGPGLVDEDQTFSFDAVLILYPLHPPPRDVGSVPLASHYGFF